ncbi:hypothetical protein Nepgr_008740 [Nepenthes gracilis]|uniref:Nudix hydrolase domain-containing protein n=1 Tax=Nepenthes gracilis TaxID=150966 RepID=A0AAD3XJP0_NEPGR|nr:hypothetical protein Nepgr_008740 [Nepenthes gracilis]
MASLVARTGRHRQRYEDNYRLVSGCIPYRLRKEDDRSSCQEDRLEVVMISSPNRDHLVFPKGGWEEDETVQQAACREALEEAGLKGKLKAKLLGIWEFRSKSSQSTCSLEGGCRGYMFALEVTEELETWPEQGNHHRKWLCIKEAFMLCRYEWMREALDKFLKFMAREQDIEKTKQGQQIMDCDNAVTVSTVTPDCETTKSSNCFANSSSSELRGSSPSAAVFTLMHPCFFLC